MQQSEQRHVADIFEGIVEKAPTGNAVKSEALARAQELRTLQDEFHTQTEFIFGPQPSAETADQFQQFDLSAVADTLEETGQQVGEIVGSTRIDVLPSNIAGFAYQGQDGSSVIDVSAALHPSADAGTVIDVHQLSDVVEHELQHEGQAQAWNTESVDVGAAQPLTRLIVSEVAAMSVQNSIAWVSADYKEMMSFTIGLGITPEQARETADTGDLQGLADDVNGKEERP